MATSKYFKAKATTSRMPTRGSPSPDNDTETRGSPTRGEGHHNTVDMDNLFAEITKMSTTLQGVAADILTIKQTTSELKITVNGIQEKLEEAEGRIHHLEDVTEGLINNRDRDEKRMDAMWSRLQLLENHSKRNNVRLVGLKETYGTNGTMVSCVRRVLSEGLGVDVDGEFEVERAHRSLAPVPNDGQPPRPVLIRFLRQSARDKVVKAAREKRGIEWEGTRLSLFPDMTQELAEKRKTFTTVKRALQRLNVRYTLAHPASLRFTWKGKNQIFTNAKDAEKFIRINSNTEGTMSKNTLLKNEELQRGEYLMSNNGRWKAVLQHDGNFVLYDDGKVVWASNTHGSDGYRLCMQPDCNLVIYNRGNVPKWATNTYQPKAVQMCRVVLTDEGKLELYRDEQIWSSADSHGTKL